MISILISNTLFQEINRPISEWPRRSTVLKTIITERGGNVAVVFALALPLLAMAGLGGIEVVTVAGDRHKLQTVAELAALAGAKQLNIDSSSSTAERAKQFATAQLARISEKWSVTVDATIVDQGRGVQVAISGRRPSFFGSLLPPGGWKVAVNAVAEIAGETPLCILAFNEGGSQVIGLEDSAAINAPSCGIQSNNDVVVGSAAKIQAGAVMAVSSASGSIRPAPLTDAPSIADPFSTMTIKVPSGCSDNNLQVKMTTVSLAPGVHCGKIHLQHGATLELLPGEHYFTGGDLVMQQDAQLNGTDVVLIFDDTEQMRFQQNSQISIAGRKSGPFAGFVLAATRVNSTDFEISTDHAHQLLGTVYIPNGTLSVSGSNNSVADQSAWTVIVAKGLHLTGSPSLVVNSNYGGSVVPVPLGVGDTRVKLTR